MIYNGVHICMMRVIYPVGLGAFCIERFIQRDRGTVLFDMMYDCGSKSGFLHNIVHEAERLYADKPVDLVCISHFDDDHINGFKQLLGTPVIQSGKTTILMPQIVDLHKLLERIQAEEQTNYLELRDTLERNNYKVVEILPIEGEIERYEDRIIEFEELPRYISSGIKISVRNHLWEYIPFNNFNLQRNRDLLDALMQLTGFDKYKIDDIHHARNITEEDIKKLKKAYQRLGKTEDKVTFINRNSLQILSKENVLCGGYIYYSHDWVSYMPSWAGLQNETRYDTGYCSANASCMYTGDSVMDNQMIAIQQKYLGNQSIGLFQIPHHGSEHCYKQDIMERLNYHVAFVNTNITSVTMAHEILNWQHHNIHALLPVLAGNGGIFEYVY